MSKTKKKKKHRLFWHFFRIQLVLLVLVLTAAAYYFYGGYGKQVEELRQEAVRLVRQSDVDTFKANQTSIVYASDGSVISTLKGEKDSYYVSIEEMPVDAVTAIVSIEDKKFFRHHGIDYRALLRAVKAMVQNGEVKQGGWPGIFFCHRKRRGSEKWKRCILQRNSKTNIPRIRFWSFI